MRDERKPQPPRARTPLNPWRYLAGLTPGRYILWCYFLWWGMVLVRYFAAPRLDTSLRITIGTPAQNDKLLQLLAAALQ